ncbi:nitrogenase-stabilizing/protective protein NifW [Sulfuriferula nivalis]|uniref:Nitrogenase-stabilizing/protective protein NifW n=1 Tax=Sulfuriferula nivalis TaxID=2675298 RepID=A0A809SC92_9PROT|nr:nitrogenase-stabilizing/protective protein NifW [Sulfuriferula nivalis]BBO99736.1 nitrogenase-stabilizing/protective protein NifW [Sulfuriferula nivalis]
MSEMIQQLKQFSAAEEFLNYFGIPYDETVVNVNRLHILKRFYQYMRQDKSPEVLDEVALFKQYRGFLMRAYEDFVNSNAAQEKVFKVFQDAEAKSFGLDKLRSTLPTVS